MKIIEKSELDRLELEIQKTVRPLLRESGLDQMFIDSIRNYVNYVGFTEGAKKLNVSQSVLHRIAKSNHIPRAEILNRIGNEK